MIFFLIFAAILWLNRWVAQITQVSKNPFGNEDIDEAFSFHQVVQL